MSSNQTVITLVIDGVGIPTLEYLLDKYYSDKCPAGEIQLPNLSRMGLGNLLDPRFHEKIPPTPSAEFAYAIEQASISADSVIGHREIAGFVDETMYPLMSGFPKKYIKALEEKINRKIIFKKVAGGYDAIAINREEHEKAKGSNIIMYASKCDPAIQIAAHEFAIHPHKLWEITQNAFDLALKMDIKITRAIARPYIIDTQEKIIRTHNRRDVVVPLNAQNLIALCNEKKIYTAAVGKVADFLGVDRENKVFWNSTSRSCSKASIDPSLGLKFLHHEERDSNPYSIQGAINEINRACRSSRPNGSFIFVNLTDTDTLYGHTRDVAGSLLAVQEIDRCMGIIEHHMKKEDVLIVTADHGMLHAADYGYHSKEAVPFLAMEKRPEYDHRKLNEYARLFCSKTLASVGHLTAQLLGFANEYEKKCGLKRFAGK